MSCGVDAAFSAVRARPGGVRGVGGRRASTRIYLIHLVTYYSIHVGMYPFGYRNRLPVAADRLECRYPCCWQGLTRPGLARPGFSVVRVTGMSIAARFFVEEQPNRKE